MTRLQILINPEQSTKEDITMRIYCNPNKNCLEDEQICGDIIFKGYLHQNNKHIKSWLPSCISQFFIKEIKENWLKKDICIAIRNELPKRVGRISNCRDNFTHSFINAQKELLIPPALFSC